MSDAANLTAYVSKDDGTVTVLGDTSATEDDATNAKGMYTFDLTQAETNGDKLKFTGKSSTSNVTVVPQIIYTVPAGFTGLTAAALATAIWQDVTAGDFTTSGSIGKSLFTSGAVPGAAGGLFIAGTNAATTVTTSFTSSFTGNLTGSVGSVASGGITAASIASGAITNAKFAAGAIDASAIADAAIDRATFAADTGFQTIRSATAQGSPSTTTLTLDSGASATDSFYVNDFLILTGGNGAGQTRYVTNYVGSTKVATVNSAWLGTQPDSGTTFAIVPGGVAPTAAQIVTALLTSLLSSSDYNTASSFGKLMKQQLLAALYDAVTDVSPTATSFKGSAALDGTHDGFYSTPGSLLVFTSGALEGKAAKITGYTASTRLFTFASGFPVAPANGDGFLIVGLSN